MSEHEWVCRTCGARVEVSDVGALLGWACSNDAGEARTYCPQCSRDHVRSMEAKIDEEYW
ncbi:MAG: hypothetical protein ABI468_02520 [Candidatus Nanopelagicales bacterium]